MAANNENQQKLTDFFREEYQALTGFVRARLDDTAESEAEDIVQEVALRIFSRLDDRSPINNIAGFVYRSVRNRIIDILRSKKVPDHDERNLELRWTEFAELFYGDSRDAFPEEVFLELRHAISELAPEYRAIVYAVDFEGFSYREIAERTGVPPGTLMSRRHRALARLAEKLNKKDFNA